MFARKDMAWTQEAYVKASNTEDGDCFGTSVALSGRTLVTGAPREVSDAICVDPGKPIVGTGAIYVFARVGSAWLQQASIKGADAETGDLFGTSIALFDNTLAVGAPGKGFTRAQVHGGSATNTTLTTGEVYVFTRLETTWTQQVHVTASNPGTGNGFGSSIALSGNTLTTGTFWETSNATGINGDQRNNNAPFSGAIYIFR